MDPSAQDSSIDAPLDDLDQHDQTLTSQLQTPSPAPVANTLTDDATHVATLPQVQLIGTTCRPHGEGLSTLTSNDSVNDSMLPQQLPQQTDLVIESHSTLEMSYLRQRRQHIITEDDLSDTTNDDKGMEKNTSTTTSSNSVVNGHNPPIMPIENDDPTPVPPLAPSLAQDPPIKTPLDALEKSDQTFQTMSTQLQVTGSTRRPHGVDPIRSSSDPVKSPMTPPKKILRMKNMIIKTSSNLKLLPLCRCGIIEDDMSNTGTNDKGMVNTRTATSSNPVDNEDRTRVPPLAPSLAQGSDIEASPIQPHGEGPSRTGTYDKGEKRLEMDKHFEKVEQGHTNYFKSTISLDDLLYCRDKDNNSLLSRAVMKQNKDCAKAIYNRCPAILYFMDVNQRHALHHAASRNNLDIIEFLISADVTGQHTSLGKRLTRMQDMEGDTALMIALKSKNSENAVKLLIQADLDFDQPPNDKGDTPLKFCLDSRMHEMFKMILELAPIQSKTPMRPNGWTILHYAASIRGVISVETILDLYPDCSQVLDNDGQNFLHIATKSRKIEVLECCIKEKPDLAKRVLKEADLNGWTSLHHAASIDYSTAVQKIVEFCPDCAHQVDSHGMNFLHVAAQEGSTQVVKHVLAGMIIPHKVLNKRDNNGNTPLHVSALSTTPELTRSLLYDRNVEKNTVNKFHQHVLQAMSIDYDPVRAGVFGIMAALDEKGLKGRSEFDLVVGALIATVSFTAGITVPGGYINEGPKQGTAALSRELAFQVFLILNTFALLFSLHAVFSHYCARHLNNIKHTIFQLNVAKYCTLGALYTMMAAFIAGSFAVLADSSGFAISVCAICCCFFISASYPMCIIIHERGWLVADWIGARISDPPQSESEIGITGGQRSDTQQLESEVDGIGGESEIGITGGQRSDTQQLESEVDGIGGESEIDITGGQRSDTQQLESEVDGIGGESSDTAQLELKIDSTSGQRIDTPQVESKFECIKVVIDTQ